MVDNLKSDVYENRLKLFLDTDKCDLIVEDDPQIDGLLFYVEEWSVVRELKEKNKEFNETVENEPCHFDNERAKSGDYVEFLREVYHILSEKEKVVIPSVWVDILDLDELFVDEFLSMLSEYVAVHDVGVRDSTMAEALEADDESVRWAVWGDNYNGDGEYPWKAEEINADKMRELTP